MSQAQLSNNENDDLVRSLERRNAELTAVVEQLRASEERWRTIIRTEPECVKIVDPEGQLVEMNPAGLAMLDAHSVEEVRTKPLIHWVAPEHRDAFARLHRKVMAGESGELEFEVIGTSGVRRWLHTHAAPLRDKDGRITSLLGISHNITNKRALEEQLRQSQKMEAIGQLAGGIAHDFNNILTVIQGFALVLEEGQGDSERSASAAREIVQAAERASSLTKQLLAFSRRQVIQPRHVDLNDIVSNIAKMMQRVVGEDVRVRLSLDARPLRIRADTGMIEQMIMNLVINARDAMPSGGTLTIETNERDLTVEEARLNLPAKPGPHVCMRVTDTGCGISRENLARIFEPFFTTKDAGKGTGLGLATVFGIVTQHGGAIRVHSELERGTTFEVLLPEDDTPADAAPAPAATGKPRGGTETILVVEDDAQVRMLTRMVLERAGYTVLEASTANAALHRWKEYKGKVDLVLTDLVMPEGINGHQLADRLRLEDPKLKVVFTSGYSPDLAGSEQSLTEGNFVSKPSTPKQVLEAVRRRLDS